MYLGDTGLLVKPVVAEGVESVEVYLADDEVYYDYFDFTEYNGKGYKKVLAPLEKVPLLMRGGHIFPRRDRVRRSSALMKMDPVTLVVVLPKDGGHASGEIYLDDGDTFEYEQGAYIHRQFVFDGMAGVLRSEDLGTKGKLTDKYLKSMENVRVEKVIFVGVPESWKGKTSVVVGEEGETGSGGKTAPVTFHQGEKGNANWAVVRDPGVGVGKGWKIEF
jgi:alpha 1,3-glucosidase